MQVDKQLAAKRESKYVEFKEGFDVGSQQDWCEIIKDIVAMANSGGGHILFGIANHGDPSGWKPEQLLSIDPAKITDQIASYTEDQFSEIELREGERDGQQIAVLTIRPARIPMIFAHPGTYPVLGGKQKTAFGRGTIYFRHGAKSEPGNSTDLRQFVDREIEAVRKSWLGNIRKVVTAPRGHSVRVLPPEVVESNLPTAAPIRIVDDPAAPAYRKVDPDKTHPFRQKEVTEMVNKSFRDGAKITPYDIQCIRGVFGVNEKKPQFFYKSKFSSPQYSQGFVDWILKEYEKDASFFLQTRAAQKNLRA